jgi:hypothetical protein
MTSRLAGHDAATADRARAAVAARAVRHRPAAASARDWIDSLSARAQQRSIRRAHHQTTVTAAEMFW